MQPEMCWQLRSPWACKLLLAGEEWDGKAKGNNLWGTSDKEGAWAGCGLNAGAAYERIPGKLSHPKARVSQRLGLLGWLRQGWVPMDGQERAGPVSQ